MVLVIVAACSSGCRAPEAARSTPAALPPYASAEPITSPRVFAPGVISTADPEFAITFATDGATAYFDRASADRKTLAIVASAFANGAWQPAAPVASSTAEFRDVDPFVAGDRLYFSSNRPRPDSAPGAPADFDTWYVVRGSGGPAPGATRETSGSPRDTWSAPVHVEGAPSGPGNQLCVSIARDGTLYFQSDATGGGDIYRAPRVGDAYPAAAPLAAITTPASESNPAISPDGTLLVFASERDGGLGGTDLYASPARDGVWSPARNLGADVNSPFADFAPAFSPDGKYLFFTSERPGVAPTPASERPPGDIYQIDITSLGI